MYIRAGQLHWPQAAFEVLRADSPEAPETATRVGSRSSIAYRSTVTTVTAGDAASFFASLANGLSKVARFS